MESEKVPVRNVDGVEVDALNPVAPVAHATVTVGSATAAPTDGVTAATAVALAAVTAGVANITISSAKNKRGPGRPKTRLDTPYLPSMGIVTKPMREGNILEMVYNKPMMFRKMFTLLNNFNVQSLRVTFMDTGIEFAGIGHYEKEVIQLTMYGKALTAYYVKNPQMVRYVYLPDIDRITKTINKSHNSVSLVIREEEERSRMHLIFHVTEYDADLPIPIKFSTQPEKAIPDIKNDDAYPVKFEIDSPQFKSIINSFDSGLGADVISIKKIGLTPLILVPMKDKSELSEGMSFKDPTKINLRSAVPADDIFSASVKIAYFRALASANIGSRVDIWADKFDPISFTTMVDRVIITEKKGEDNVTSEVHVARIKLFIETEK